MRLSCLLLLSLLALLLLAASPVFAGEDKEKSGKDKGDDKESDKNAIPATPPQGDCAYRFSLPDGIFELPQLLSKDVQLTREGNRVVTNSGGSVACNADIGWASINGGKYSNSFKGDDGQTHYYQHVLYLTANDQLYASTLQTWQSSMRTTLMGGSTLRLQLTCNPPANGGAQCLDVKIGTGVKSAPLVIGGGESSTDGPSNVTPTNGGAAPTANSANFIVDGNSLTCPSTPQHGDSCFFGMSMPFQQTCSPACYWGGLCNVNRCVKQRNSCIVFCPSGFECSYGYCVKSDLMALFLQQLVPHLYSDKALVQPANPSSAPLLIGDGTSNAVVNGGENASSAAAAAANTQTSALWIAGLAALAAAFART